MGGHQGGTEITADDRRLGMAGRSVEENGLRTFPPHMDSFSNFLTSKSLFLLKMAAGHGQVGDTPPFAYEHTLHSERQEHAIMPPTPVLTLLPQPQPSQPGGFSVGALVRDRTARQISWRLQLLNSWEGTAHRKAPTAETSAHGA